MSDNNDARFERSGRDLVFLNDLLSLRPRFVCDSVHGTTQGVSLAYGVLLIGYTYFGVAKEAIYIQTHFPRNNLIYRAVMWTLSV